MDAQWLQLNMCNLHTIKSTESRINKKFLQNSKDVKIEHSLTIVRTFKDVGLYGATSLYVGTMVNSPLSLPVSVLLCHPYIFTMFCRKFLLNSSIYGSYILELYMELLPQFWTEHLETW